MGTEPEEKSPWGKSFWTTLPGILTGVAAVVAAIASFYIATSSDQKKSISERTPPTSLPAPAPQPIHPAAWPLVGESSFTESPWGWKIGSYPIERTPRFELRVLGGKYRWDVEFRKRSERVVEAPYGSVINFLVAVDVRLTEFSGLTRVDLLFGMAGGKRYVFRIRSNNSFGLGRFEGIGGQPMIIDSTPIQIDPKETNRMAVSVHNQEIKLYLNSKVIGEYRDPAFTGGKVGLSVGGDEGTATVVDFDNFELRSMPR